MRGGRILVVDDEESLRRVIQVQLEQHGYDVSTAGDAHEALAMLARTAYSLVLTDLRMHGESGLDLLKKVRQLYPQTLVILITAFGTVENAVEAMQSGAYHYITKPVHTGEMLIVVNRALEHYRLREEVTTLRATLDRKYVFENIIGRSSALLSVLDMASRAAQSSSTVLVEGETGTGKELLARAIHFNSPRKDFPFLTINCGAIPKDLLESELFGYKRGAFTGALENKQGKVEMVNRGTLFLDEIGELPLDLQVKLLRLIQQGEVAKIGALETTRVDVRIVAATNRNLRRMVDDGTFRDDLYYRLAVVPITLPPLRERAEDIPDLVHHLFEQNRRKHNRPELRLPGGLLPFFSRYHWPGNIRELENVLERMVVLSLGPEIRITDLPELLVRERPVLDALQFELPPGGISLDALERELIMQALARFGGNQTKAAQYLDLTRKTLIYRIEKYGLKRD